MYKIILSDGRVLNNIDVNGTVLISKEDIDSSIFEHNLSPVDIELIGDRPSLSLIDLEGHHENMTYSVLESSEEFHFTLSDIPESEMRIAKMASDIEYMAMMNDIEL